MSQTRTRSALETIANVAVGYTVSVVVGLVVFPLFGIHAPFGQQLAIGCVFTVISLIRGYALRRLFNAWRTDAN